MPKPPTATEKPYNNCLPCQHRKEGRCDGPRTSAMPLTRWCEFMRDLKTANGLTNQQIADRSGVSIKTIERIMAGSCDKDIYRETARLIEDAIIGSSNQYPCYLVYEQTVPQESEKLTDTLRDLERALGENQKYQHILDAIHTTHNQELQTVRDEAQRKIDYLRGQLDFVTGLLTEARSDNAWLRSEIDRRNKIIDTHLDTIARR